MSTEYKLSNHLFIFLKLIFIQVGSQSSSAGLRLQRMSPTSPSLSAGSFEWGYVPEAGEPSTADLIAQQSQDYVDERLQEFQATIVQLQSECLFFLLFIIDGSLFLKISKHTDTAAGVGGESDRESASGSVKVVLSRKQSHKNLAHVQ